MNSEIEVFDTDGNDLPHAVNVRGEVCSIRVPKGNFGAVVQLTLTVDEAVVLREKLATWLFHQEQS